MTTPKDLIERHIGKGGVFEITNEDGTIDKIEFPLLRMDDFSDFMQLFTKFAEVGKQDSDVTFLKLLDVDTTNVINRLLLKTMKLSCPELDDESLGSFIKTYYFDLLGKLIEVNTPRSQEVDTRIKDKLTHLKKIKEDKAKDKDIKLEEIPKK